MKKCALTAIAVIEIVAGLLGVFLVFSFIAPGPDLPNYIQRMNMIPLIVAIPVSIICGYITAKTKNYIWAMISAIAVLIIVIYIIRVSSDILWIWSNWVNMGILEVSNGHT